MNIDIIQKLEVLSQSGNKMLSVSILILSAIILGRIVAKLKMPEITGYIITGIILGKSGFNLFSEDFITSLETVNHIAVGLMAFIIGTHLNFHKLKTIGKRVIYCYIGEELFSFIAVLFVFMFLFKMHPVFALLISAISVSTAPATTVAIVQECKAKGTLINTLMPAVAINNAVCITLFGTLLNVAQLTGSSLPNSEFSIISVLLNTALNVSLSVILGILLGFCLKKFSEKSNSVGELLTMIFLLVSATTGLSGILSLNPMLPSLVFGIYITNATTQRKKIIDVIESIQHIILLLFFVIAGMHFDVSHIAEAGVFGVGYFFARGLGKTFGGSLGAYYGGTPARVSKYIGLTLIPQSGVAIGLIMFARQIPSLASDIDLLITIVLATVALNEIVGPVLAKWAITKSGESNQDRPKLIEFIGEEYITTGIKAKDKNEAISKLVEFLIKSHDMSMDLYDQLLTAVLSREAELSTGIGGGIAVPHGVVDIPDAPYIWGCIGISKEGINFQTFDGKPVYLIVLVITPSGHRDKHLKILSEIARMLDKKEIKDSIFKSETPTHVYEILRKYEISDFNYFID